MDIRVSSLKTSQSALIAYLQPGSVASADRRVPRDSNERVAVHPGPPPSPSVAVGSNFTDFRRKYLSRRRCDLRLIRSLFPQSSRSRATRRPADATTAPTFGRSVKLDPGVYISKVVGETRATRANKITRASRARSKEGAVGRPARPRAALSPRPGRWRRRLPTHGRRKDLRIYLTSTYLL
ncbi:hypothetical protein EVAR_49604_1 [Eumeta japonica]|uniref:Uncharacterized protein n=1 Tax=Eumeta variegata TaxID=151549 RepID=A0A4C1Y451_EUMVA|nr:hypothetical protein EVAR_49604_1 [Eumeta japonica]